VAKGAEAVGKKATAVATVGAAAMAVAAAMEVAVAMEVVAKVAKATEAAARESAVERGAEESMAVRVAESAVTATGMGRPVHMPPKLHRLGRNSPQCSRSTRWHPHTRMLSSAERPH
jgi:hypothetical protein